jgi:tetratricopeptide (TPR) repeat protein
MRETPSPTVRTALLLMTVLGLGCRSETERLFAEAARAEAVDDYEGAAQRLREITIGHPESPLAPRAQLELAQIHLLRTRDVTAALATLAEILDKYPESDAAPSAHRLLGRLYQRELQDPQKAILHYRAALAWKLDVATERETLLSLGQCHYRISELDEAASVYRRAVELAYDETSDAAYFRLATLSRLSGDHPTSLRWLEELARRTQDESRRYAAMLGQVEALLSLGQLEDAQARLREAERLSPDAPENEELQARLDSAASEAGEESDPLDELEKRIRWGSGRAPRRER